MPTPTKTAVVFVDKKWYDETLAFLVAGHKSTSNTSVHILEGTVKDDSHPLGMWFIGVKVRREAVDAPELEMDLLVPWTVIRCCGVTTGSKRKRIGFKGVEVTNLTS